MTDSINFMTQRDLDLPIRAFGQQHRQYLLGRAIAEQLPERFLVPRDAVVFDHLKEIIRRVAAECRLGEMFVIRKVTFGARVGICEIAPPAT